MKLRYFMTAGIIVAAIIAGCVVKGLDRAADTRRKAESENNRVANNLAYELGIKCGFDNIPPEANPYVEEGFRVKWLWGWKHAKDNPETAKSWLKVGPYNVGK